MAHTRKRLVTELLQKRMKLWPVIGVMGARQVGKTTLLKELLRKTPSSRYFTMDLKAVRDQAQKAPEFFISSETIENKTLILDEVQKAPDLFDAIKADVDSQKRPGRFILSGSTQFSSRVGIRESLTGRIGLFHIHPMLLSELKSLVLSSCWIDLKFKVRFSFPEIKKYIELGGMPGICFLRSTEERHASFESWIDTTCFRDLVQIKGRRLSGQIAKDILECIAKCEYPTVQKISKTLSKDPRIIKNHLEALEHLFVIRRLDPHPLGTGASQYLLFDSGLHRHLNGSVIAGLRITLLNEIESQYTYSGQVLPKLMFYRSRNQSFVDLVVEPRAGKPFGVLITDQASPSVYALRAAHFFQLKLSQYPVFVVAPSSEMIALSPTITLIPWTAVG